MSHHPLTSFFDADLPLTSSHRHNTLGNPGDQSMSDLPLTSSHGHSTLGNPGDQSMDRSLLPAELLETDPFEFDASEYIDWSAVPELHGSGYDELPSVPEIRVDGVPSLGLAADAAARGEIGHPASGSSPGGALHVAVGDELPEPTGTGHASHVQMEGSTVISTATIGAVLEAGSLEDKDTDFRSLIVETQDEDPTLVIKHDPRARKFDIDTLFPIFRAAAIGSLTTKTYQEDAHLIRDLNTAFVASHGKFYGDRFVDPQDPPSVNSLRRDSYITRFLTRLEGDKDKSKEGYWKEKDVKVIRDPSARRNIIGLKRTLAYMNGSKRTHWLADEYVALDSLGDGAVQIREEMAVRTVYEEGRETAPPSKCSKTDAHSSGESYIWQYMTRVYVKGEGAGSTTAPSLLYAICHECDKALKCPPKFGNGNLNKHLERVHDICSPCKSQHVMTKGKGVVGASAVRV
ncbi:unnamed protein product [Urochloa decumbens]|uniref:C2H2-type domain-containing protein n=1 Tax=Urochloa decumbens TaxID=240449 RepID=A0ABC9F6W7_9POAL